MSEEKQQEESFIIKYKKEIMGGLLVLIAVIFFIKNNEPATFWYFVGAAEAPLVVFLVLFYGLGFFTHYIFSYFKKKELKNKVKALEKGSGNKEAEKNIAALEEKIAKLEKELKDKNTPPSTPPPAV